MLDKLAGLKVAERTRIWYLRTAIAHRPASMVPKDAEANFGDGNLLSFGTLKHCKLICSFLEMAYFLTNLYTKCGT